MNPKDEIQTALLKELGIADWPQDKQQEALATVAGPIFQSVTLAILEQIPVDKRGEFEQELQSTDAKLINDIITAAIPNPNEFIESEVRKAITELKTLSGV